MKLQTGNRKALRIFFACVLLMYGAPISSFGEEYAKVTNVHSEPKGDDVVIYYDFAGSKEEKYRIDLILLNESEPSFMYAPKNIRGDVGVGMFVGANKQIVWSMKEEFPQGIQGGRYYFEVRVERLSSSSNPLIWIGAGAVVLGAVAALHFLGSEPNSAPSPGPGFPAPPGRP